MKFNLTLSLRRLLLLILFCCWIKSWGGMMVYFIYLSSFSFQHQQQSKPTTTTSQPASQTKSKFNFKGASSTLSLCFVSCHHGNPLHLLILLLLLYKKPSRRTFVRAYSSAESGCHKMIWDSDSDKRAATEFISACTLHYVI